MVFKRYIKKNGKLHGPYYYESYREDGKVKKRYIGTELHHENSLHFGNLPYKKIAVFTSIIILIVLSVFFLMNMKMPQPYATLDLQQTYGLNEKLAGTAVITIQSGESISQETNVDVELTKDGQSVEKSSVPIGDFISASPEELFKETQTCENVTTDTTENVCHDETTDVTNPDTGEVTTETSQVCADEPVQNTEEKCTTNSESLGFYYGAPGSYSTNLEDLVDYTFNEPGNYVLEISSSDAGIDVQKEFVIGESGNNESSNESIANETINNETIPENQTIINETIENQTIVNNTIINETINNETIANQTTENLTVANETIINETIVNWTISLIKDIPNLRIPRNGSLSLNLSEYFYGAESYEFEGNNITASFDGNIATLAPDSEFKGAVKARIAAINGSESLESNEFNVLVSSGAIDIKTGRGQIKVGEPVKWIKNVTLETPENVSIELPKEAENIEVTAVDNGLGEEKQADVGIFTITGDVLYSGKSGEGIFALFSGFVNALTGRAIDENNGSGIDNSTADNSSADVISNNANSVVLDENATEYVITYETPAPTAIEENTANGKQVIIAAPSELNYTDVLAYTNISEIYDVGQEGNIKIYWEENSSYVLFDAYDLDGNGKIDYLEWNVPHLSNQTFDIILITKAEHLDSNRTFVEDVYDYVKTRDGSYTTIPSGDYLRVTFQQNLTNANDITLYAKSNSSAGIEVYEKDSDEKIADFGTINEDGMYKILLTNLQNSQDTFDLKVIGDAGSGVDFDYVVDPDSEGTPGTEWDMFHQYLNHTAWDGVSYVTVPGRNAANYTTGGAIWSSPAVANGYVYIGSQDARTVYQLNASNASQLIASYTVGSYFESSPAVANGYVYIGNYNDILYQLNASNVAQLIASYTTGDIIRSSPAVATINGISYVYVGSNDGKVYQLNATNISRNIANFTTGGSVVSSLAVATINGISYVYVGSSDKTIYQLNATNITQSIANFTTGGWVYSPPAVATINGISYVYVGSDDRIVYQLNATNISRNIANFSTLGNVRSSPAVATINGISYVYVGSSDKTIYQLNATNITQSIANFTTGGSVVSSPAVATINGISYVYVGSLDNKVYQLNATNISRNIANYTTGNSIYSSPAVANGFIYIGSTDYKVYQLNATNISLDNIPDTTSPNVTLIAPANATTVDSLFQSFNATFSDNIELKNATFYLWNSANDLINITTQSKSGTSDGMNLSVTLPYEDVFKWNYLVYDAHGNFAWNNTNYTLSYSVVNANQSSEGNSTEWRMFHQYLNHTAWDGVSYSIISGLNRTNYTTGGAVTSSPAVANGYVYVGSNDGKVYQLNASNVSQLISNYTTGGSIAYSSPAVANGYVYIGSNDKKLYQLNATNISINIANYTTGGVVASSPAVANGYVYVGSNDGKVYQLNATNISINIANFTAGGAVYSSPAVANGYVYVGSWDGKVYQLNASNISQLINSYSIGAVEYSSPAVANGYVYVGRYAGNVYQLNATNISKQIASFTTGGETYSSPAVANGYVYIGSDDNSLYQLNATNISKQIASFTTGEAVYSSPAVATINGISYVYVGSNDYKVYQLNATNISRNIANYTTGNVIQYSSPAVANGYVYVGSNDGKVYQLNAMNMSLDNNFPDTAYPIFSNNKTSIANGSQYLSSGAYKFNITIANTNGTAGIEFNSVNYSLSNSSSVFNKTFTGLGVGVYPYYYWAYGSGSGHLLNQTEMFYYTVVINSSYVLSLTELPSGTWTETYGTQTSVTGAGCSSQLTCNLYQNNVSISNGIYQTLGAGTYSYLYNTTGNNNYSSKTTNTNLIINPASQSINSLLNGVSSNLAVNYPQQVNASYSGTNKTLLNIFINRTQVNPSQNYTRGVGWYNVTWSAPSNQNYTAYLGQLNITVSQGTSSINLTLNGVQNNVSIVQGGSVTLNCSLISGDNSGILSLFNNSNLLGSGTKSVQNLTTFNTLGLQNITCSYASTQNYSTSSATYYVNVFTDTIFPVFSDYQDNNGTLTDSGMGIFNVTVNNTNGTVWLNINGTNITAVNYSLSFYNLSYQFTTNGTYPYIWYAYGNGTSHNLNFSDTKYYYVNYVADTAYPIFSDNKTSIANGSQYLSGGAYQFNTTITNTNGTAGIEFNSVNYSLSNLSSSFYVSFTDLGAGVYPYYYWAYGSGSGHLLNQTEMFYYTVITNSSYVLSLTELPSGIWEETYGTQTNITGSCPSQLTCNLFQNNVSVSNAINQTLTAGKYSYLFNTTGNGNYSSNTINSNLTINLANQSMTPLLNGISSNLAVTYPQQVNASFSGVNRTLLTITINGTQVNPSQNYTYGVGWYNVTWSAPSNNNYTAYLGQLNITISQAASSINLTLNGTQGNVTILQGSSIPLNCSLITGDSSGVLSLLNNSNLLGSGANSIQNLTTFNTLGLQNITCSYGSTQNYSASSMTYYVNVLSDTIFPVFSNYKDNNGTLTNSGMGIFNVTVNNTNGTVWLNINGTNITAVNYSLSFYNLSYQFTTNGTYPYIWYAYGNGSTHNLNSSGIRNYFVNYTAPPDTTYPVFSAYQDDNASVINSGTGHFNVTLMNTNGTVLLDINNQNYTARNDTLNVYNVSVLFATNGTYSYKWHSWGNGSAHNYNVSDTRNYYVNYSDTVYPKFLNFLTSVSNGSQYLSGRNYQFNTTITNTNGTAGIEFNSVNYSLSNLSSSFYTSFTDLGAGVYPYYYWAYGSGSANLLNQTDMFYYIVITNSSYNLSLTEAPSGTWSEAYGIQTNVTGNGCPSQLTCNLFQNNISISNAINQTLTAGKYSYLFNTTGNSNYSSNTTNSNLTINLANQSIISLLNGVNSNLAVTYPQQVNASFSGVNKTLLTITINGTQVNPNQNYTYGVGWYNVTWSAPSNNNYTAYLGQLNITISQAASLINLTLNGVQNNVTILQASSIPLNCSLITGDNSGILSLFNNSNLLGSGTKSVQNLTTFNTLGLQNITCSYASTQNYSTSSATYYVNVLSDTIFPVFSDYQDNNGTLTNSGMGIFNVTVNNTNGTVWLNINGTNITAVNYSLSFYNLSYQFTTNGTYPYIWYAYGNGSTHNLNSSGTRNYYVNVETTPPNVTLIASPNGSIVSSATQSFNATFTDNIALASATFYLWNSTKDLVNATTNSISGISDSANISVTLPYQDVFEWNYLAYDTSGNSAWNNTNYTLIYSVVNANQSSEGNSTEWKMFHQYLNHTAWDGISYSTVSGLNRANYTTADIFDSSPAVANGYVYIGSYDGNLYQLNATNISKQVASYPIGGLIYRSSPAIANGYVYIGSGTGQGIWQLNASDVSQLIASYATGGYVASSPAVADGYVYIGSNDHSVYQLNASNVSQLIANYTTGGYVYSSPAIANGYVYVGSNDGNLYQLNASNVSQLIANYTTSGAITYSSPAVADGYVYIGSNDRSVYQLNASNVSNLVATYTTMDYVASSPAIANGYVYVGSNDGNLYQLNATDISKEIASYLTEGIVGSSPAIANGYVYVGSNDGNLYQLNASNVSQSIANYTTGGYVQSSPAIANGYVYIGSNDHSVYQLNATDVGLDNPPDTIYPVFSNYKDNNGTLTNSGMGIFNVTVNNTNGTVWLNINGTNITAVNYSLSFYNLSYQFTTNGTYPYIWYAYGNGSHHNLNSSDIKYYYVNYSDTIYPIFSDDKVSVFNGSQYSSGRNYQFNITIEDTNGTAGIEFNSVNYSLSNLSSSFYVSFTDLGAGVYPYYYWAYGAGGSNLMNQSQIFYYTVITNSSYVLSLTELPSGTWIETYGTQTNITGAGCPSQLTCNLYENNVSISNGIYQTLGAGTYSYIFNTTGNSNYLPSTINNDLVVNSASTPPPGGGGGGGGGGGCVDTIWANATSGECINGTRFMQQRSNCGKSRTINENCSEMCIPVWNYTYGGCINGTRTKIGIDSNCGLPDSIEDVSCAECESSWKCGSWSSCQYGNDVGEIFNGVISTTGTETRICSDLNGCSVGYVDSRDCDLNISVGLNKEKDPCDESKDVIQAVNKKTGQPIATIDLQSWVEAKRFDVKLTQSSTVYCPTCYNGVQDDGEQGIDCGGQCGDCRSGNLYNYFIKTLWALIVLLLLSDIAIFLWKRRMNKIDEIRGLIKEGKQALRENNAGKARLLYRNMRTKYGWLPGHSKELINSEIIDYYNLIADFKNK